MRPIVALAILLLGLKAAEPELKVQHPFAQDAQGQESVAEDSSAKSSFAQDSFVHDPFARDLITDTILTSGDAVLVSASRALEGSDGETIRKSDRMMAMAVPDSAPSDIGHDQGEAAEPPLSPALARTPAETDVGSDSLEGLCNSLLASAKENDLPAPFFANLIWQESGLQRDAVSPAGALGIAQFMPETAVDVRLQNPFDPRQAIPASARLLRALRADFGNLGLAAAAYNAGPHRVRDWLDHHRALPHETRSYVVRITGRSVEQWRKTPPEDSALTFMRPLPCRDLPAFADLVQAQAQLARQSPEASEPEDVDEKPTRAHRHVAKRKLAHHRRGEAERVASRSHHRGRHEATHRLKHKMA
jgi:hypothetical protein